MMLGGINWFLRWYRAGGRLTVDEIAEAYVDFILYGLLAPSTAVGDAHRASTSDDAGDDAAMRRPSRRRKL